MIEIIYCIGLGYAIFLSMGVLVALGTFVAAMLRSQQGILYETEAAVESYRSYLRLMSSACPWYVRGFSFLMAPLLLPAQWTQAHVYKCRYERLFTDK